MQFQVPQFIETEDKIVGPLSLRQFGYLGTAAGISAVLFFVLQTWLWAVISVPVLGAGLALAFAKVNGRPISAYVRALFQSIWSPSVYVFRPEGPVPSARTIKTVKAPAPKPKKASALPAPDLEGIKNLWMRINTSKTAIPKRERPLPAQEQSFSKLREKFEAVRQITGERETARRVDYR